MSNVKIVDLGECALLIQLADHPDSDAAGKVFALAQQLRSSPLPGITDIVPSYTTLAVHHSGLPCDQLASWIQRSLSTTHPTHTPSQRHTPRLVSIPVCYDPSLGIDLLAAAATLRLSPDELIRRHVAPRYEVRAIGFLPGFPYLAGLDPSLHLPRKSTPRAAVPAGSVAIGGAQTGIYPLDSPGGWHLLGRTPLNLFTPHLPSPTLLQPGDHLRFTPITLDDFHRLQSCPPPEHLP